MKSVLSIFKESLFVISQLETDFNLLLITTSNSDRLRLA